tara:strand:+ start:2112 stop:2285 length:174 start_codon:yes stop_codon:yes gene_type:complete
MKIYSIFDLQGLGTMERCKHHTKSALANYLDQAEQGMIPTCTVIVTDRQSLLTRENP